MLFFAALFAIVGIIFEATWDIPFIFGLTHLPKIFGDFRFVFGEWALAFGHVHKP